MTAARAQLITVHVPFLVFTVLQVCLLYAIGDRFSIAWAELPLLAGAIGLARVGRISPVVPLVLSSVVLYHLSDPATGMVFTVWFLLLPLLYLTHLEDRPLYLLGYGFWSGFLVVTGIYTWTWHATATFFELSPVGGLIPFLLVSAAGSLPIAMFPPLLRLIVNVTRLPIAAVAPLLFSFIDVWNPLPTDLPLSIAYAYAPLFLQTAAVVGEWGVTFQIAIINAAIFHAAFVARGSRRRLVSAAVAVVVILLQIGYGVLAISGLRKSNETGSLMDVAIIQPMAPLKIMNRDIEKQQEIAARLEALSHEAVASGDSPPDLLIWPEGAGPFAATTPTFNPSYMDAIARIQEHSPVAFLVQCVEFTRDESEDAIRYYNVAALLVPENESPRIYRKVILMPFTEYLPGEQRFPFLRRLFGETRRVLAGESPQPIVFNDQVLGVTICYESLFPGYVRDTTANGATILINLTNDRWYGPRQQPLQHLAFSVLRAIENRRPLVRATNSGISAFISPTGDIAPERRTSTGEITWTRGQVAPRHDTTLFTRTGTAPMRWMPPAVLAALLIYAYYSRRRSPAASVAPPPLSKHGPKRAKP